MLLSLSPSRSPARHRHTFLYPRLSSTAHRSSPPLTFEPVHTQPSVSHFSHVFLFLALPFALLSFNFLVYRFGANPVSRPICVEGPVLSFFEAGVGGEERGGTYRFQRRGIGLTEGDKGRRRTRYF